MFSISITLPLGKKSLTKRAILFASTSLPSLVSSKAFEIA
jgi:hypothetical protein